jgi:peptidoglycan/LPS O-acetylase OafA/YrhL
MAHNGTVQNAGRDAGATTRGGALDALRFAAAVFVVLYHFGTDAPVEVERLAPALTRSWVATDFFLMLSGYVLGRAYGAALDAGRIGYGAFVARRLKRIWPAHLVVLAGFAGLMLAGAAAGMAPAHADRYGLDTLLAQAGLVHAWGVVRVASWNVPSWTLSALVVCYLVFPLAWRASRPLQGRTAALLGALDVLALAALAGRLLLHRSPWDLPFDLGAVRALPIFLCGLLLARAATGLALSRFQAFVVAAGGAAALALFQSAGRSDLTDLGTLAALAFAVLGVDAVRGLRAPGAAQAARLSFALFVSHALAGAVWFAAMRAIEHRFELIEPARWALWAGSLPFALAVAWAFDRFVDQPIQRALKGRFEPSARARAPRPGPATLEEPGHPTTRAARRSA